MFKHFSQLLFIVVVGCGGADMNTNKPCLEFEIGSSITHATSASTAIYKKDCVLDICVYKFGLAFSEPVRAKLTIKTKSGDLQFDDIVSASLGTYGSDIIGDANVTLGGVDPGSKHSEALHYFYQQMDKLHSEGWKRYIFQNEARLRGSQLNNFKEHNTILNQPVVTGPWVDPGLRLKVAEWLTQPMISTWYFHKDGVYLLFRVQREDSEKAPQKMGSYLFTLTFESEAEFYKSFVKNEYREDWIKLLPAELNRMAQERAQTEARLKKMGIAIDEDYQDPPIKALE